jgi:hypothetical protein
MYQGETYKQSCSDGACCNAKDGKIVRGFLIENVKGGVFILTPTINYGDHDYGNMLQYFYSYKVKPNSVKKISNTKHLGEFAMQEYSRR